MVSGAACSAVHMLHKLSTGIQAGYIFLLFNATNCPSHLGHDGANSGIVYSRTDDVKDTVVRGFNRSTGTPLTLVHATPCGRRVQQRTLC